MRTSDRSVAAASPAAIERVSVLCPVSAIESIPHAPHADDEPGIGRVGLDLPAQADDVVVHGAVCDVHVMSPDGGQQVIAAEHGPTMFNECREQLELDG